MSYELVFDGLDYRHALMLALNLIAIDTYWTKADPLNPLTVELPTQSPAFHPILNPSGVR